MGLWVDSSAAARDSARSAIRGRACDVSRRTVFWPQGPLFSISVLDVWYWHAVLCLLDACAEQTRVLGAKHGHNKRQTPLSHK